MSARALKRVAPLVSRSAAVGGLVSLFERLDRADRHRLPVLTYHRVREPASTPGVDPRLVSATPDEFERQVAYLTETRHLVSASELLAVRAGERELPPSSAMLTFDDAYADFAAHAWPILRAHRAPVTLFVATGYPGRPERRFWWDRLHAAVAVHADDTLETPVGRLPVRTDSDRTRALRRVRDHITELPHAEALALVDELTNGVGDGRENAVLTWPELRALAEEGVTLAPHSATHPLLDRVPLELARAEIQSSIADLEREIGDVPPLFAYPGGAYTGEVVRLLAEAGVQVAFTTKRGVNDVRDLDWLRVGRINVGRNSPLPVLRAELVWYGVRAGRPGGGGLRP